jgi:hypothetical protein
MFKPLIILYDRSFWANCDQAKSRLSITSWRAPMTSIPLSASPPLQLFLAVFNCISKCIMTFSSSHLCGWNHLRVSTHARIAITLCFSLTMRVATRHAGVTTSVVAQILPRGVHQMPHGCPCTVSMRWKVCLARTKELENKGKH